MIEPNVLKRLAKGVSKDATRVALQNLHVKDNYVEITDGRLLVREIVGKQDQEGLLEPKTFQKVEDMDYPKTQEVIKETLAKKTVFQIAVGRDLLEKVLKVIPKNARLIFNFKGKEGAIHIKPIDIGEDMTVLVMPMTLPEPEPELPKDEVDDTQEPKGEEIKVEDKEPVESEV